MAACPSCQKDLADDFGLVDCPSCGAGLFIEFDGSVRLREPPGAAPAAQPEYQSMAGQHFAEEVLSQQQEAPASDSSQGSNLEDQPPIHITEPVFASENSMNEDVPMTALPEMVLAEPEGGDQMMDDLAAYGNSQSSNARDGAYFYDLVISGIDSADIRTEVKEALTDSLFLWDVEALMRNMKLGQLNIEQVTSVKAALVVQRLMSLPVKLKLTQHAITEA